MSETTVDERSPLVFRPNRFSPKPDNRTPFQRNLAVCLILLSAGFERLAFYSLAGNLTFFLDSTLIKWTFPHTIIAPLIFLGTSYISALVFSWVSDGRLGRAKTIIIGFTIYSIGYIFMILFANEHMHRNWCPKPTTNNTDTETPYFFHEICIQYILPTLIFTAIGVGAVQANMAVFGADQVRDQRSRSRYFDIYYAAVNTGGLIAFGAIAYLQINVDYFIGYLVPGVLLILASILFLVGYKCYIHIQPHDSVITEIIPVTINAFQVWRNHRRNQREAVDNIEPHRRETVVETEGDSNDYLSFTVTRPWSFFDYAKLENNGRFSERIVNDIKSLRRIILVFLLLIPYWLLYIQVETTFIVQGAHMKLPSVFKKMPVVWLSLGNQIIIIVTIFLLNAFVYKRLIASGRSFSINTRIIIGMISAAFSMCLAGTVEIFRQNVSKTQNFTQIIGDKEYLAANMSVFFQFPQYVGIGLSEVFTSVASLEFAYLAAPQSAQSLIMSLRFCSAGLSSFFGSGIVGLLSIENGNQTSEIYRNDERYYIYFFGLAGLQIIFVLIFLQCNQKYKILKLPNNHLDPRHFISLNSDPSTA